MFKSMKVKEKSTPIHTRDIASF